jgi:hypothetical protein
MAKQITQAEAFALLLEACPGAHDAWEEHKLDYADETKDLPYLGAAVFARHIVEMMEAGWMQTFTEVFQLIERLIVEGDEEVRGLATVGFLEDIQSIASWKDFGNEAFVPWLMPKSLASWQELIDIWAGKHSLAEVVREEFKGK